MISVPPVRQAGVLKAALKKEKAQFKFESPIPVSKIFPITFRYLQQVFHTRVLEIKYNEHQIIYKAVLESKLCADTNICWLQRRPRGWDLQLGQNVDQGLVKAITLAIDQRRLKLNRL